MNFNAEVPSIATTSSCCKVKIRTPQRKAVYSDKARIRLKDIKRVVLRDLGCSSSAEVKQYLQSLEIKLDLRYTSSWVAISFELRNLIKSAKEKLEVVDTPLFKSGDRVTWDYPMGWSHIESWFPLIVVKVEDSMAYLDILDRPVPVKELTLVA